jgi:general stress protein 26
MMPTDSEIEARFWKDLAASPFMMLGLDGARDGHTQPMTAKTDGDTGPIWFFATKSISLIDALGDSHRAIATYTSKGHDIFASIHGTLSIERDPSVVDRLWDSHLETWFEGGKTDPKLALLRLDTENAEIWQAGSTIGALISRVLGKDPKADYRDNIAKVSL